MWTARQFRNVVNAFRDDDCDSETWDEVLTAFAILLERGPSLAGPGISKKLTQAKDFWELRAKHKNSQPRLLFYIAPKAPQQMNFVYCFMKKSDAMYKHAVEIADKRRKQIEAGEESNAIDPKPRSRVH